VFLWQFLLPLIIFVLSYWKILGVIRRRANVISGQMTTSTAEPVAGTSRAAAVETVTDGRVKL